MWLVVKNRLSKSDRMRVWSICQGCVLCGERDETRDHVFFAFPYTFIFWDKLANRWSGDRTYIDWMATLQFVSGNTLRSMDKTQDSNKNGVSELHLHFIGEKLEEASNWFSDSESCGLDH